MTTLSEPPTAVIPAVEVPVEDVPRNLSSRTLDDSASLIGAAIASLSLDWIIYEKLLAFSGVIGFVVSWWALFVLLYMGVTALSNPWPSVVDRAAASLVTSGAMIVGAVLVWVIVYTGFRGWPALHHWNFYSRNMSGVRGTAPLNDGGIWFSIVGSGEQVGIATAISLPLGICTAIFLNEVGGAAARVVRTVVEAMTALPDILAGLFVYTLLIHFLGWQKDGLAVSIALSVTMVPIVARSAEVVLRVVPGGLREASLALGASTWGTIWRVVLPTARAGLATSLILGIARIAGETAPLLIVDEYTGYFKPNPTKNPQSSLPLYIYSQVRSGETNAITRAFGAATLLLALVLVLFVIARLVSRDKLSRRGPSLGSRLANLVFVAPTGRVDRMIMPEPQPLMHTPAESAHLYGPPADIEPEGGPEPSPSDAAAGYAQLESYSAPEPYQPPPPYTPPAPYTPPPLSYGFPSTPSNPPPPAADPEDPQ